MEKQIFVNLPVRDLNKSVAFFQQMGYTFNPLFTDETAACMVISDTIYTMLLTHDKFREFTRKEIADAHKTTEVLICLNADSKEEVNRLVARALQAGATETDDPSDYGYMFSRRFHDPDGHIWEILWMDMTQMPKE